MAAELHALLHGVGTMPPYVLVGHSMGGLVARVFIQLYREEVAGLALIDSSHPGQKSRLPKLEMRNYRGGKLLEAALAWTRPLGLRRLARDLGLRESASVGWSRHRRAGYGELLAFDAICRDVAGGFGDLRLAVVTSSELDPNQPTGSRAQRDRSLFYPPWAALQDELATLSTNSTPAQRRGRPAHPPGQLAACATGAQHTDFIESRLEAWNNLKTDAAASRPGAPSPGSAGGSG